MVFSDVLATVRSLRRQSNLSRQAAKRKLENESQKNKKEEASHIQNHVNDFKLRTSMSNNIKCYNCKVFFTESMVEVVPECDIENPDSLDRRFEKYHMCKTCRDTPDKVAKKYEPFVEMKSSIINRERLLFYPNFEDAPLTQMSENDEETEEPSSNPALDALIVELSNSEDEDSEGAGGNNSQDEKYPISIMFPNGSDAAKLLQARKEPFSDITSLLYDGKKFDNSSIRKLYEIQCCKYLKASSFHFGNIKDPVQRLISLDAYSMEEKIHGSSNWKKRISDEMKFRFDDFGHCCLRISIKLEPTLEANIATCLMQLNKVVTVSMSSRANKEAKVNYYVHRNHDSGTDCDQACVKVELSEYLSSENLDFDMKQLNNKFVPGFTLLCSQKMDEFVKRIVKSSSSNLFSEDYFFQLVFGVKNETKIEGVIWPKLFSDFNSDLSKESFTGVVDANLRTKFLDSIKKIVLATSDSAAVASVLEMSENEANITCSKVNRYQLNIAAPILELPSLIFMLTRKLTTPENNYAIRKLIEICNKDLNSLSNVGKLQLSTMDWLENFVDENIQDQSIVEDSFNLTIGEEVLSFVFDDYLHELLARYEDLPFLAPYHYCLSFSKNETMKIVMKRLHIRDCFTKTYNNVVMSAFDSEIIVEPCFGFNDWRRKVHNDPEVQTTCYMKGHNEISLGEAISLIDPRKFRVIASRPVQYIHSLPSSKILFKKLKTEDVYELSYKGDKDNCFYELMESHLTRYYKRLNGQSCLMSEFVTWYDYEGSQASQELFQTYKDKIHYIQMSEVECINGSGAEKLPELILLSNADVMKKRKVRKVLKFPNAEHLSFEFKFSKVLLYQKHRTYEELTEDTVSTLYSERVNPLEAYDYETNPRVVDRNER